ncbi:MAG TPA: cytochrome c3 family protein [Anaeromyxobacter sp.]|nr:cytochrome c3 family protein [Anaeromyxobacter sp.]
MASRAGATMSSGRTAPGGSHAWIAGLVAGAVAGAAGALAWPTPPSAARQPIAFDHRLHVGDQQIACEVCHAFDAPAPFSGLPGIETCATCHSEPLGASAEEAKVVAAARSGAALAWEALWREPRHVFFSHRLHAGVARIACEACHPGIAEARAPPPRVRPIRMSDCLACHARAGGPSRCTACHR